MGMEIQVNSPEEMCSLMCDNVMPKRRKGMTNKEAKRRVKCCRDFLANNYSDMGEPNYTALTMAINALSAIEDIKADIIRHSKICDPEFKDAFEVTVQIIDKHIGVKNGK